MPMGPCLMAISQPCLISGVSGVVWFSGRSWIFAWNILNLWIHGELWLRYGGQAWVVPAVAVVDQSPVRMCMLILQNVLESLSSCKSKQIVLKGLSVLKVRNFALFKLWFSKQLANLFSALIGLVVGNGLNILGFLTHHCCIHSRKRSLEPAISTQFMRPNQWTTTKLSWLFLLMSVISTCMALFQVSPSNFLWYGLIWGNNKKWRDPFFWGCSIFFLFFNWKHPGNSKDPMKRGGSPPPTDLNMARGRCWWPPPRRMWANSAGP